MNGRLLVAARDSTEGRARRPHARQREDGTHGPPRALCDECATWFGMGPVLVTQAPENTWPDFTRFCRSAVIFLLRRHPSTRLHSKNNSQANKNRWAGRRHRLQGTGDAHNNSNAKTHTYAEPLGQGASPINMGWLSLRLRSCCECC